MTPPASICRCGPPIGGKGDEMGGFLLGSAVVMLFPEKHLAFNPDRPPARPIRIGEVMGSRAV